MRHVGVLSFSLILSAAGTAHAQQAIVTMPSADITPQGKSFFMHESQLRPWSPEPYWNTTHFFTHGLGFETELTVTLFNLEVPSRGNTTLALGFKTVLPLFARALPETELKLTFGAKLLVSLNGRGPGHWVYAHGSFRLPVLRTRLAAGASHGTSQLFEVITGAFIASLEQPLGTDKLNLVAEWFSGDHDLGNLIVGATYHPDKTWIYVLGYKIPTSGERFSENKEAIVAEIGAFF